MQKFRNERGQIIVILALAMVALIGFTALAVDGSLIYNARRQDQNTADSAALAGAGAAANYLKDIQSGTEICGTETGTIVTGLIVDAVQKSVLADGILAEDMPKMENDTEMAAVDQGFNSIRTLLRPLSSQRHGCIPDSQWLTEMDWFPYRTNVIRL